MIANVRPARSSVNLGTILEWAAQKQNTPGDFAAGVSVSEVAGRPKDVLNYNRYDFDNRGLIV